MSQRLLIVDILAARNVIACERNGTSNPYVVANLLDIERDKTPTDIATLNPKWNHRMTLGKLWCDVLIF
jgi:Ca2+-dependent lipid-binding protein